MATGKADVDTTALLGGKQLRVFGRAPWPDTEAEQEEMWAPMIEQLREICDYVRLYSSLPRRYPATICYPRPSPPPIPYHAPTGPCTTARSSQHLSL